MDSIYNPNQTSGDYFHDNIPFIMEGQVVDVADPDQMGRVRVWIPALDGESFDIDTIPWADYASPFFGFTVAYPGGNGSIPNNSSAAYGMWAIPKMSSTVLVFCVNGSPTSRCYFAGTVRLHRNRSLPAGRNVDFNGQQGPWGDSGDGSGSLNPIQPAYDNIRTQFQNKVTQSEALTRGAIERQVAQAGNNKSGTEGYTPNPADPSYLDPQTYCLVTPGRHALIMQDDPAVGRLRLKTGEGHQIIFDDANERIYMSTSKGRTWVELDQDGHLHIFGAASISMSSGADINMFAAGNINMEAAGAGGVNIVASSGDARISTAQSFQVSATQNIVQSACGIFDINSESAAHISAAGGLDLRSNQRLRLTGDSGVDLKSGAGISISAGGNMNLSSSSAMILGALSVDVGASTAVTISGATVNINGPAAESPSAAQTASTSSCAAAAGSPAIVPTFEPWTRPASATGRGANWKA